MDKIPQDIVLFVRASVLENNKEFTKDIDSKLENQTAQITASVAQQSKLFNDQIIKLTEASTELKQATAVLKTRMILVAAASGSLGGMIGFLIRMMTGK